MAIPTRRADLARERIRLAASQQARARARAGLAWKHPSSGRSTRDPPLREHPIYYIFVRPHHAYSRHTLTPYPSRELWARYHWARTALPRIPTKTSFYNTVRSSTTTSAGPLVPAALFDRPPEPPPRHSSPRSLRSSRQRRRRTDRPLVPAPSRLLRLYRTTPVPRVLAPHSHPLPL